MLYIKLACADDEQRPDKTDEARNPDNWLVVAAAETYKGLIEDLVQSANDELFTISNSWLMLTSESED